MVDIRVMTHEDLDFAVHITHQEGWGYNKEDLDRIMQWSPDGCFVMWDQGRRIGMATSLFYGTFGWVGNVVIDKDHRGRGLGKAMMKRCTSHIIGRGAKGVRLFAYENTRAFYERLGFSHEGPIRVFRRDPKAADAPPPREGYEVHALDETALDASMDLDSVSFIGDRRDLLRAIWRANAGLCLGLWKDGALRCALFGKKVLGNVEVGPWLCDLPDARPAIDLLDTLLSMINCSVYTAVPESQTMVLQALDDRDFKRVDRVFAMSLGQLPSMRHENILAVGALEKG